MTGSRTRSAGSGDRLDQAAETRDRRSNQEISALGDRAGRNKPEISGGPTLHRLLVRDRSAALIFAASRFDDTFTIETRT
jgi:hypothetical protein